MFQKSVSAQESPRVSIRRDESTLLRSIGPQSSCTSSSATGKPSRKAEKEGLQEARRSARILRLQAGENRKLEQVSPSTQAAKVFPQSVVIASITLRAIRIADLTKASQHSQPLQPSLELHLKPKRARATEDHTPNHEGSPSKRPKVSSPNQVTQEEEQPRVKAGLIEKNTAAIETWIKTQRWPPEYFTPDIQVGNNFFEAESSLEEPMEQPPTPVIQYVEINGIRWPRPIPRIQTSLRQKKSSSSLNESSNEENDKFVTSKYRDNRYPILLAAKGSYIAKSSLSISNASKTWCMKLIDSEQIVPENSLFRDDIFDRTCGKIQDRNEARVVQDVARLIVPSAETLATYGAEHLGHLIENVDETWSRCIPFEGPKPKPDYSVGFTRASFTEEQFSKLSPVIGTCWDVSVFAATTRMYFPFFTCESKCGAAEFEVADRQNAHSMTVAIRGVVELYRLVRREQELHREILAFSVSHDSSIVKIFGHYAIIDGKQTTFFRHPIREFSFQDLDGREKWTAYKFTKNVYDIWMPMHLKRICSAIDQLPLGVSFEVSRSVLQFSDTSELSRGLDGLQTDQSNVGSASEVGQDNSETVPIIPQMETPDTSDIPPSQGKEKAALKRPKRKHTVK